MTRATSTPLSVVPTPPPGGGPTSHADVAVRFARAALADRRRRRNGKWIRLAARRFLRDLRRAAKPDAPFVWSPERANHACAWIETLPHVEGTWDSETIRLVPAQVFFVAQLFGFRTPDGRRRFTEALYSTARKNAKSTLAAAIMLYVLCNDPEPGAQLISAATTGSQARIIWDVAHKMAGRKPALRRYYGVECFARSIVRYPTGGSCRAINAKASTQDGLNPSLIELDEVHAHKTHDLMNVLRSAAGARGDALWLYLTTEGYESPGPWPELLAFAKNILEQVLAAEHFLALYFACDEDDDDFSETAVIKANPLYEVSAKLREAIAQHQVGARAMPGTLAEYQIKRLNRRASVAKGAIDLRRWRKCSGAVPLKELIGQPCWGGLDLGSTRDMTSAWWLWLVDGIYYAWGRYWVPTDAVAQRTERRTVPYQAWVDGGLISMTSGDVADYEAIQRELEEDVARFQPRAIGYDPWNATALAVSMAENGAPMEQFIQGPRSYHPALQALERAYVGGNFRHGGHPVLLWNASNVVYRRDVNLNQAPDRRKSSEKIDGFCALAMAFGMSVTHADAGGDPEGFLRNPARA